MVGVKVNGYEIIEFLGKGQFGSVYRCKKNGLQFAIKIFSLQFVMDEYSKNPSHNRITQEIESLKRSNHVNIVKIYEYGSFSQLDVDYFYLIMEYLSGSTLKELIKSKGKLDLQDCLLITNQLLDGIGNLHENSIIHRDLKPDNLFVDDNLYLKILDFGLSKLIDFSSLSTTGAQIGTPLYMSPEQIIDSKNVDFRSDYYAIGVILFEMLTGLTPYQNVNSLPELYNNILHEVPLSILRFEPSLSTKLDDFINSLLEKENYKRPNSISAMKLVLADIVASQETVQVRSETARAHESEFGISFYLRVYNDYSVLKSYFKDGHELHDCIFPINHKDGQKSLLQLIRQKNIDLIVDPATIRLTYETFADTKGVVNLPYAPKGLKKLEIKDLKSLEQKKNYVKSVIDEQIKLNTNAVIAPNHMSDDSRLTKIKYDPHENWFSTDVKLLKVSKEYLKSENILIPLVASFSIKIDLLTSEEEQTFFLNVLSSLPCDKYLIYVDRIDYRSSVVEVFNYIKTLYLLQKYSGKPVISGRTNALGLLLLSVGLHGFESGTSRFESFYEELYSAKSDPYNMYVMYYIPQLIRSIPIERKNPLKIFKILKDRKGISLKCDCPYCSGKAPDEIINDQNAKKHFLYVRQKEIETLKKLNISERLDWFQKRLHDADFYYKQLSPIFKREDYAFVSTWKKATVEFRNSFGL